MTLFRILLCSATLMPYFTLMVKSVARSVDTPCPKGCNCHTSYQHIICANVSLSDLPTELPNVTTKLQFSPSDLPVIPMNAFLNLPALTTLYLSSCSINRIRPGAFNGLSRLQFLHLNNNSIQELEEGVFENVTMVTYLYLENNLITNLTPGVFSSLRELNALYLSNNRLTTLLGRTFKSLSTLRWLYLSNNRITAISPNAFTGNKALRKLYLDGNKLTAVPMNALRPLKGLNFLQLSNNNISRLNSDTSARKLRFLVELYLDNTFLDEAPSEAFSKFPKLEVLSMKNNRLVTLSSTASFRSVKQFGLSGNAWRCDCGLIWLRDWLLKQSTTDQSEVTCSSPSAQSGELLVSVQPQYLTCPSYNLDVSTTPSLTAKNHSSTPRGPPSPQSTAPVTPPNTTSRQATLRTNTLDKALPTTSDPCLSKRIKEVTVSEITTSSLLVNWNVLEDLGDEYELWYSTGREVQNLHMIGGVREVELSQLNTGAVYKICVIPQSSNINKCLWPTANQCTEAQTLGSPGNTEPVQSGAKNGQYALGAGIAVIVILLIITALIVAFKLKTRRTGFQRHYDEDVSMYIEHFEIDQSKMDFDQIDSAYENIIEEGNMYFPHMVQSSKVEAECAPDCCTPAEASLRSTPRYTPLTNNFL